MHNNFWNLNEYDVFSFIIYLCKHEKHANKFFLSINQSNKIIVIDRAVVAELVNESNSRRFNHAQGRGFEPASCRNEKINFVLRMREQELAHAQTN